jgi:hypothetical protein
VQGAQGRAIEGQRALQPGHAEPVLDVVRRLVGRECAEVVARHHALRQLLEAGDAPAQLGLADQHDLQQLALGRFQVRQQAQLLQQRRLQRLRLVDDDQRLPALGMHLEQEAVERIDVRLEAVALGALQRRQAELAEQRLQQLQRTELRVEDVGHHAAGRQLLEKAARDGGLAGADLAGEQHEAAAAAHAVQQMRQRLAVALAHEQEVGVGRERKRLASESEVRRVHGREG